MSKKQRTPEYFGKYLLLERIAVGGMAEIFRAVLRGVAGFEKTVALKRILPVFGHDDGFVTLFQDEARTVSTLTHANIAQVFEFGVVDDSYFLTMELIEGTDLSHLVKAVAATGMVLEPTTAAFIVAEAASGLSYAHNKRGSDGRPLGIVHRDVSPQNVLVSYSGGVKVTDFGIAKARDKVHQTATGMMMGKLRYMSPEQVAGQAIDGRSDVFALGVVLYELITGGPVFPGEQSVRLAELIHTSDIPPPSAKNSAIPSELDRIAGKALARDIGARYQSAAAFAKDLTIYRNQTDPGFTPQDLGDLVTKLFPLRQQPQAGEFTAMADKDPSPVATKSTLVQRKSAAESSQVVTPSGTPLTPSETVDVTRLAHGTPTLAGKKKQMDLLTRTHAGQDQPSPAPIELVSRRTSGTRRSSPSQPHEPSVSREAWFAVGLGVAILASVALVLFKFVLPGSQRAHAVVDAALLDANPDDIDASIDAAPNALGIVAGQNAATAADHILRRLQGNHVVRRGTASKDYIVFLNALDFQLASIGVDAQGRAAAPRPLPTALAMDINEHNLGQPLADVVEYLRLTGKLPVLVSAAAQRFVADADKVGLSSRDPSARRLPPHSVAALAAWFSPESPDLVALALANSRLDRFCPPARRAHRRAMPFLCEHDALMAALDEAGKSRDAAALRNHQNASDATSVTIAQATFTIDKIEYAHEQRGYQLRVIVSIDGTPPADTQYLLQAGGMRSTLRASPRNNTDPISLHFSLPQTMYAPVFAIYSSDAGSAHVRLRHLTPVEQ